MAGALRKLKKIKGIQIGKEDVIIVLFADIMYMYPKHPTRKLIQPRNTFRKAAE